MNKKLAVSVSGGAVLVLALSGCTGDDNEAKVNAWAKSVCGKAQPQIQKRADAQQAILSTPADGKPADIQAADSKAFQDIADANTALAAAVQSAGTPPVENGATLQQDAIKELKATAAAYVKLKEQVDALNLKDQQKFGDGLQDIADGLSKIEKMDQDALSKLQSGELGKAMAKQPGCQKAKPSGTASANPGSDASASAPAGEASQPAAKPPAKPSNATGPSKSPGKPSGD
ncbi:small secreted protein [Streptomyces sp. NPDC127084]|uniref:small secreted protein n=1 Tax=Streptomyces sp. NPDC127084 TaxID=3347133 RepID=UPI00364A5966